MMQLYNGLILFFAGLFGAMAIGLAAYSSHSGANPMLGTAWLFALFHAVALLALAAVRSGDPSQLAQSSLLIIACCWIIGASLFCSDLTMRGIADQSLFHFAAPIGGSTMIAGWTLLAFFGLFRAFKTS